jgi:hypothetical protein
MSNRVQNQETSQGEVAVDASGRANEGEVGLVFGTLEAACEWSKENAGRAFARCANDEGFRPVSHDEAYQASQSWHESEELFLDGPYRDEMD